MTSALPIVRPAVLEDARGVIELISSADENALIYLTGKRDLDQAKAVYRRGFCRNDVYYSYLFTQVCFIDGRLAGCILAFPGYLEPDFISDTRSPLPEVREAEDDELYIDSLAVYPEFRGHRLSSLLLDAVQTQAKSYQLGKLSLLADDAKPHLEKMYARYGFKTTQEITLDEVVHQKMVFCISEEIHPHTVADDNEAANG